MRGYAKQAVLQGLAEAAVHGQGHDQGSHTGRYAEDGKQGNQP
jgi:hypothetical protein